MVCLIHYWSSSDLCRPGPLKMSLGDGLLRALAAREVSLLMPSVPGEDTASIACDALLGYAYFFACCSGFVPVICSWPLLWALTRKLGPSLV
jgi:hypothetical protein